MSFFFCFFIAQWSQCVSFDMDAHSYDSTVMEEPLFPGSRGRVRYVAENVSDSVWACDSTFILSEHNVERTVIRVFTKRGNEKGFGNAGTYAKDVLECYCKWFGGYFFDHLNIVDGHPLGGANIPQLIIMNSSEDPFTRLFEAAIAGAIGEQYFNMPPGAESVEGSWLGEGLATYAAIRYMEDKYGAENSLIKTSLLPALSLRYFHRFHYYVAQTNQLEIPVTMAVLDLEDISASYFPRTASKSALFLFTIKNILGRDVFDRILGRYYKMRASNNADVSDFMAMCDEASDYDLGPVFDTFLNTAAFCDWSVNRIAMNTIEVENRGDLDIPVRMYVRTRSDAFMFLLDAKKKEYQIKIPFDAGEVISVAIDSSEYTLDPDYWNNYCPRKVSIKPVFDFDWPSFSTYQILWLPYLWYDRYDGFKAGLYLFGDKFADFDFVKGGYQFTLGYVRGFGSGRDYPNFTYQTPVLFREGVRVRVRFSGFRSRGGDNIKLGLISNLGRPLSGKPPVEISNMLNYAGLFTYSGLDSIDWDLGKNLYIDNNLRYRYEDMDIRVRLSIAHRVLGSEWEYFKTTFDVNRVFEFGIPIRARLFIGKIFGTAPVHERLFLSGCLRTTWLAETLFGQSGPYSPQERVHVPGDGNMRGYQMMHIKSDQMYALNLEFPARSLLRVFTDIGYYDHFAFDIGVRLVIGTETFLAAPTNGLSVSLNLPLYSYIEGEPWKLRWSLGLSI
ncbi:MAG: hypothetical protein JSW49_05295 [candidate division WOR-3 bacterium]|nr:MAG: hypothetical protein JSW49_05295 [candidate division WOR-3 bacterium]